LTLAGARRISQIDLAKTQDALAVLRREGMSQETINHHIRAVKAFSRWLWKTKRSREHILAHLATANPEGDRRRKRRALSPEEAGRLIGVAETGPAVKGLDGRDRAMLLSPGLGDGVPLRGVADPLP
jgi:site-specific recombinase XerD